MDLSSIDSRYVLLCDEQGNVLAEKNADMAMYPASLTKMMTALTAVGRHTRITGSCVVPSEGYERLIEEDASLAGFPPGETVSRMNLLRGCLMTSGAECSYALAKLHAGSVNKFVDLMNRKAALLGMENTTFTNCTGLHDANHVSTPRDLMCLLRAAWKNPVLNKIMSCHAWITLPNFCGERLHLVRSTLFRKGMPIRLHHGHIHGGKTGFTDEAGRCLASWAHIEGKTYFLIVGGCMKTSNPRAAVDESSAIYNMITKAC